MPRSMSISSRVLRNVTAALALVAVLAASAAARAPVRYYLIGNSLTWDTVPSNLAGDVRWHVDCGKSLPFMYAHPEKPCVKSSTPWPKALKERQYDFLVVQPFYGSTLAQDVDVIAKWAAMQPHATLVIHTGWARQVSRAREYAAKNASGEMQHSPVYIQQLIEQLRTRLPGRQIRQTHAIDLLDRIAQDIAAGKAPFKQLGELHRDAIHMTLGAGRYLMHNAMRKTLGQPPSTKGFEKVDPTVRAYLDQVLAQTLPAAESQACGNAPLREELLAMMRVDQEARAAMLRRMRAAGISFEKGAAPKDPTTLATLADITRRMNEVDEKNRARLKIIVQQHGWPGANLVGSDGAHAAWLLVQHADADRAFQKQCLDLMEKAPPGTVAARDLAYLTDRLLVAGKKPQRYGTQLDGDFKPLAIEDEAHVDQRRAAVGLSSMAEYLKMARQAYAELSKPK